MAAQPLCDEQPPITRARSKSRMRPCRSTPDVWPQSSTPVPSMPPFTSGSGHSGEPSGP